MIKKVFGIVMLLASALCINAQQLTPLPLNPAVKSGQLPNGLSYYILHNEEPKERANFYIAQKVGSTLEAPEQLGLAHFLEHMAFNGTKNYPGKDMLNYLQSKGIRFGADINAYTAFDETVYNINNVPTKDTALMDSVLLVLHDWSCDILLEEDEINAERGVIEEEWRSRNTAQSRMMEAILPVVYQEYQYQQTPIGKMEVVKNFPPEVLRAYYKKWYRPDQQGIVIVGDFDAAEMEKKVIDLFSPIPMPENAAERTYPTVSDNEKPIFAYFEDAENQYPLIFLSFKYDKTPFEMRNTVENYMQENIMMNIVATAINNRLSEYAQKPECNYAQAVVSFGDFLVSKTKGAFDVTVVGKADVNKAFNDAMAIVTRACKTGFTDSEISRVRDEMLANYEKAYNERNNTKSNTLAQGLIRHFVDNAPDPGIETEYMLAQQMLPAIPAAVYNQIAASILTPENQVIIISQPKGMEVITEEPFVANLENILNAQYEAYVDEVITDPLIAKMPKPGTIKSEKAGAFGTTEFVLSNGAKVVVKPTDFKADEIVMSAFAKGGKRSFAAADALSVKLAEDVFQASKLGNFNSTTLTKYLAGKNASLSYSIGNANNTMDGQSTVKDLPTLMELIYSGFTQLNPDPETFASTLDMYRTQLKNQDKNPQVIFSNHIADTRYGNNPMFTNVTLADIDKIDYPAALKLVKSTMSNAADWTFVFTGNVDANTLKPLLEQYIASIPGNAKKPTVVKDLSSINQASGQVKDEWKQPMQIPSTMVVDLYTNTTLPYNIENATKVDLAGDILGIIFTETLREEEGGTYSPYGGAFMNPVTNETVILYQFQTNADMQEKLMTRANDELMNLLNNGAKPEHFNKVKEAASKQLENSIRSNRWWNSKLGLYLRGIDDITNAQSAIDNLTIEDLNAFMKGLYNGKNRIQVIMEGVPAESK